MSDHGQLSLLSEAAPDNGAAFVVDWSVLLRGAHATSVPRHRSAGALPTANGELVDRMLELTEDALRYNQAPEPILVVPEKRTKGLGSNGPIGRDTLMADGKGIRDYRTDESATWPQLLRMLATQRADEPHIARARDLADAYHYLYYYSRAYGGPEDAPPTLLANLRTTIHQLGGNPAVVPTRSDP